MKWQWAFGNVALFVFTMLLPACELSRYYSHSALKSRAGVTLKQTIPPLRWYVRNFGPSYTHYLTLT